MATRNIYLKIETIDDYSPVEPYDKSAPPNSVPAGLYAKRGSR